LRRTLIFSVRGITKIRGKLAGTLSEIASAARKHHEAARGPVVSDVDVFAHALNVSAALHNTNGLQLRAGYRIRGSLFQAGGNGNGFLWAVKIGNSNKKSPHLVGMSRPDMGLVLPALRPDDACSDVMEAITGNFSPFSYLEASILKGELLEFGALWHGLNWCTYTILGSPDDACRGLIGGGGPEQWNWTARKLKDLRPRVNIKSDKVVVTFYARSDLGGANITRFEDTFESDCYVSTSTETKVAHGRGGFVF
jgi:hypothetical protein